MRSDDPPDQRSPAFLVMAARCRRQLRIKHGNRVPWLQL